MNVLSLGAGVQSSTMALMAAQGEITPMPDAAIFADTGWEPKAVYEYLEFLSGPNVLPFPVFRVQRGNLRADCLVNAAGDAMGKRSTVPAFVGKYQRWIDSYIDDDGLEVAGHFVETGGGPLARHCTRDYKIDPITKKVRELVGYPGRKKMPHGLVTMWIGISLDEFIRMKPSQYKWVETRWPLIEKRMTRGDCLEWLMRHDYPSPPKSACIGCPFHNNEMWRDIRDNDPNGWKDAVDFDLAIRSGFQGNENEIFLHRDLVSLDQVDLTTPEDHGQLNMFINECEGMCGV